MSRRTRVLVGAKCWCDRHRLVLMDLRRDRPCLFCCECGHVADDPNSTPQILGVRLGAHRAASREDLTKHEAAGWAIVECEIVHGRSFDLADTRIDASRDGVLDAPWIDALLMTAWLRGELAAGRADSALARRQKVLWVALLRCGVHPSFGLLADAFDQVAAHDCATVLREWGALLERATDLSTGSDVERPDPRACAEVAAEAHRRFDASEAIVEQLLATLALADAYGAWLESFGTHERTTLGGLTQVEVGERFDAAMSVHRRLDARWGAAGPAIVGDWPFEAPREDADVAL